MSLMEKKPEKMSKRANTSAERAPNGWDLRHLPRAFSPLRNFPAPTCACALGAGKQSPRPPQRHESPQESNTIVRQHRDIVVKSNLKSVFSFVTLVFILSIPFWTLSAVYPIQILPGLPLSALGAFTPAFAAFILIYKNERFAGVLRL